MISTESSDTGEYHLRKSTLTGLKHNLQHAKSLLGKTQLVENLPDKGDYIKKYSEKLEAEIARRELLDEFNLRRPKKLSSRKQLACRFLANLQPENTDSEVDEKISGRRHLQRKTERSVRKKSQCKMIISESSEYPASDV